MLYDFKCPECGATFEALASVDEDVQCTCGATAERQLTLSPPLVIYKAGGFYSTQEADYDSGKNSLQDLR